MYGIFLIISVGFLTVMYGFAYKFLANRFGWGIQKPHKSRWWHKIIAIFCATTSGTISFFAMPMFREGATNLHELIGGLGDGLALFLIWIPGTIGYTLSAFLVALSMLISASIIERQQVGNRKWLIASLIVVCCEFLVQPHMVSIYDLVTFIPLLVYVFVIRYFEDQVRVQEA